MALIDLSINVHYYGALRHSVYPALPLPSFPLPTYSTLLHLHVRLLVLVSSLRCAVLSFSLSYCTYCAAVRGIQ